jgi:Putative beta-barrel porin 2
MKSGIDFCRGQHGGLPGRGSWGYRSLLVIPITLAVYGFAPGNSLAEQNAVSAALGYWSSYLPESARSAGAADDFAMGYAKATLDETEVQGSGLEPANPPEPELPANAAVVRAGEEENPTGRRIHYHVGLTVRAIYDDNINISQTDRKEDFYTSIEPVIGLTMGDPDNTFLALTYTPSAFLFANHTENNALQHLIALTGQYRFPLLTLGLSQDVELLDGTGLTTATGTGTDFTRTNLDVSGRTRVNIYSTRLNANYSLTGKTFLTGGISYSVTDYPSFISSAVLSGNLYFNYTYSPKLSIGLGVSGGYDLVDEPSQSQTFEQINARASYEVTGKISATVSAGLEFRQVPDTGLSDNGSPIFDGTIFYQPFDSTSLSLTFSRQTVNSAVIGSQDFHSTEVILSGRQRFFQRVYLGLTAGYQNSSYFSTVSGLSSVRKDDYYFLQVSLDLNITSYWTAGLFYLYRESDSSIDLFSFYDNQIGFRTSVNF